MESSKVSLRWVFPAVALVVLVALVVPASGQLAPVAPVSPCTASMLTSFTPCANFLTNNTANVTTPTPGCCGALKALASNGTGCFCQILSGGVPFRLPINRTAAISLPSSCNLPGVPFQCNLATGAPAPSPGSSSIAQTPVSSPTPSASVIPGSTVSPVAAPVAGTTPTTTPADSPTAPTAESPATVTSTPGRATTPTASSAERSLASSAASFLLLPLAFGMMKFY